MSYITSKVRSDRDETVSSIDPFGSEKVVLPLKTRSRGDSFFTRVRAIEAEKREFRGF